MLDHKHLILQGTIRRPNSHHVGWALYDIMERVGMKPLNGTNALVEKCDDPDNEGHTGALLLTTSHMVWHDWDVGGYMGDFSRLQFDLYSCKDFSPRIVVDYLQSCHGLTNYGWKLFDRNYNIALEQFHDLSKIHQIESVDNNL
jgi:S-adenosylmethionine/arginine decarboxylase-like enzyme